ncbi:hypothetical protein A3841_11465 [Pontibacter flavimaris]|uniref:DUF4296 domain-containing protein n=2 Tax=Pontibacter flavimaris TaxID=1797110 RepID=A0A1Q5PHV3_9BACT|nr:hypothetical protein A3841_11465 [Pontibacter flavimaris]
MIPQEKMVRVLADIHTAEALIEAKVIYPDTALMTYNQEQEKIFQKYNITQEQFKDTYDYYLQNLREMDALYEIVVDTLSMRETKAEAVEGKPRRNIPARDREQLQAQ